MLGDIKNLRNDFESNTAEYERNKINGLRELLLDGLGSVRRQVLEMKIGYESKNKSVIWVMTAYNERTSSYRILTRDVQLDFPILPIHEFLKRLIDLESSVKSGEHDKNLMMSLERLIHEELMPKR